MSVQTGAMVVGAVAVIYGIGFAVLPMRRWSESSRTRYTMGGAALVALVFVALVVVPWWVQRS
ncbi:hypothetical protein ACRTEC_12200 [Janibacter indicus]|uniref:hypothetical protein n=1 Tax=Janibacter TaxID=53457 RepID=UPI000A9699E3|nr:MULTISPECIES: hypothetical protein [Janibacter]QNF95222.1 hypothetical protein H7A72_05440 [Janibacter sp. YB324]